MVVLTKFVIISQYVCIHQITMLYTLNLYNVIYELYLNKVGEEQKGMYLIASMLIILEIELHPFNQTE